MQLSLTDYLFVETSGVIDNVMSTFTESLGPNAAVCMRAVQEPGQRFDRVVEKMCRDKPIHVLRKELLPYHEGEFAVFTHGDAQLNNILFKLVVFVAVVAAAAMVLLLLLRC